MFLTSSWLRDGILTRSPNPGPYKSFASPFLHCPSYPSRDKEHEAEWVEVGGGLAGVGGREVCSENIKDSQTIKSKNIAKSTR